MVLSLCAITNIFLDRYEITIYLKLNKQETVRAKCLKINVL